jgi:hypothetical protein
MQNSNQVMCPLFPDMPCPQGNESADACKVRLRGDYNPLSDFKDYLIMNCAIQQAKENEKNKNIST